MTRLVSVAGPRKITHSETKPNGFIDTTSELEEGGFVEKLYGPKK